MDENKPKIPDLSALTGGQTLPGDPLTPVPRQPSPELLAEEEKRWTELTGDFEDRQKHNDYLGFVIRSNLLIQGSRRYGTVAQDSENWSIEQRRLANLYQQKIAKILFFTPENAGSSAEPPSKASLVMMILALIAGLMGIGFGLSGDLGQEPLRLLSLVAGLIALGGVGVFLYLKIKAASERLESGK